MNRNRTQRTMIGNPRKRTAISVIPFPSPSSSLETSCHKTMPKKVHTDLAIAESLPVSVLSSTPTRRQMATVANKELSIVDHKISREIIS